MKSMESRLSSRTWWY